MGPITLDVDSRKGRPRVDIPYEALHALQGLTAADLPQGAASWQARLVIGEHTFAQGTPLGALLATLPHLPLPKPGDNLRCSVPEGALLELDLNQHTLARNLAALLRPMLPSHGKRPGWVMLVANGGGGYWYEVGMDWREVLETTLTSLEDLQQNLDDADALQPQVQALLGQVRPKLEAVQAALQDARKSRRG